MCFSDHGEWFFVVFLFLWKPLLYSTWRENLQYFSEKKHSYPFRPKKHLPEILLAKGIFKMFVASTCPLPGGWTIFEGERIGYLQGRHVSCGAALLCSCQLRTLHPLAWESAEELLVVCVREIVDTVTYTISPPNPVFSPVPPMSYLLVLSLPTSSIGENPILKFLPRISSLLFCPASQQFAL